MEHGRDHDERRQKHAEASGRENRATNTPPDNDEELVWRGAQHGSEPAPTEQAARREAERHRLEREIGHHAAGTDGYVEGTEDRPVSRDELDEAAQRADQSIKR